MGRRVLPLEYLKECFQYSPGTGELRWKTRPREHFRSVRNWHRFNTVQAGRVAGYYSGGYWSVAFTFNGEMFYPRAHSVAWALMTGDQPPEIDHRNGDRCDNRFSNLRAATGSENQQNKKPNRDTASGLLGVSWGHRHRKWRARIGIDGCYYHLGYFPAPELAYAAYLEAKSRLHPFQPVPRSNVSEA